MGLPMYLVGISIAAALAIIMTKMFEQKEQHTYHGHERTWNSNRKNTETKFNLDICSICLESMTLDNAQKLKCGHRFHSKCIVDLFVRNMTKCPNCRATMIE